jgi:hypothetical protein
MVSEKMYELGTKKSTIRTIFEFGRKRAAEVGEENIYDFSLGNPNVPTPEFVKQAAIDILHQFAGLDWAGAIIKSLPLHESSLAWLLPVLAALVLSLVLPGKKIRGETELELH